MKKTYEKQSISNRFELKKFNYIISLIMIPTWVIRECTLLASCCQCGCGMCLAKRSNQPRNISECPSTFWHVNKYVSVLAHDKQLLTNCSRFERKKSKKYNQSYIYIYYTCIFIKPSFSRFDCECDTMWWLLGGYGLMNTI